MTDDPRPFPQPSTSANPTLDGRIRLRGLLIVGARAVVEPARRRFPFEAFRRLHRVVRRAAPGRRTDADPFTLRWVSPDRIQQSVLESAPKRPQWGRVAAGEWDREHHREPFADRPGPVAIRERFRDGASWAATPLYDHFHDQIERFGNAWGYRTPAGFAARCVEIERLHRSMRRHGYRDGREIDGAVPILDEIGVDMARDGTLLWRGYGQHRLALARLLGIERVPVLVHRRHAEWQSVRDRTRERGEPPAEHAGHPDLRGLVD